MDSLRSDSLRELTAKGQSVLQAILVEPLGLQAVQDRVRYRLRGPLLGSGPVGQGAVLVAVARNLCARLALD